MLELNAAGSGLVYSTFLGGSGREFFAALALDPTGAVYVVGQTSSPDFPTTAGAYDRTFGGSLSPEVKDGFVTKLDPTGSTLLWSTYLGGSGNDAASDVAIGPGGDPVVAGYTSSADFPTTAGAYDSTLGSPPDAFVARLDRATSALVYSTLLGGSGLDAALGVAADVRGSVYLAGLTGSADFPATTGSFDPTFNGGTFDVFVARLDITPAGRIDALVDLVGALRDAGVLNGGQANSLLVKLEDAIARVDEGRPDKAIKSLQAFVHEVEALVKAGTLTAAEAQPLLDGANEVIALLGG